MIYNDISPRTQAYADRRLLTRAVPNNILGQFGQVRTLPARNTKTINFRRYNKLAAATTPIQEGVTPTGKTLTKTDLQVSLNQFGDFVWITDQIQDFHEDPILKESTDILGEQAGETYDLLRAGVLKAGTNVLYANGTTRSAVNSVVTRDMIRTVIRILKRQEAKVLTSIVKAGPNIQTNPIPPAYVAVCHADLQPDFERLAGWIPIHQYASSQGAINGEIGSIGELRVVIDNNLTPWADAGGLAATNSTLSTTGTQSDVYPILVFAKDAYGLVELSGKNAVQTYVNNPKPSDSDPLAQRGTVGWKGYHAAIILQDLFMARVETAAKG
jgi:N4-gp56 family major capsid protein